MRRLLDAFHLGGGGLGSQERLKVGLRFVQVFAQFVDNLHIFI
jgi:hypothetical protein